MEFCREVGRGAWKSCSEFEADPDPDRGLFVHFLLTQQSICWNLVYFLKTMMEILMNKLYPKME